MAFEVLKLSSRGKLKTVTRTYDGSALTLPQHEDETSSQTFARAAHQLMVAIGASNVEIQHVKGSLVTLTHGS